MPNPHYMENKPSPSPLNQVVGQLRELLSRATPGPWCGADCHEHLECREIGYIGHIELHSPSSPFQRAEPEHDARLLVAAVNNLPALLAIAEAAAVVSAQRNGPYLMADMDATMKAESNLRMALSLLPNLDNHQPALDGPVQPVVGSLSGGEK